VTATHTASCWRKCIQLLAIISDLFKQNTNKQCSASYVGCRSDAARICCWVSCCGAVAAERRRPLHGARNTARLLQVRRTGNSWSMSPVRGALSSKPAARRCCCRSTGQTGGQTDAWPFSRPCFAYYAGIVNKLNLHRLSVSDSQHKPSSPKSARAPHSSCFFRFCSYDHSTM